MTPPKLPVCFWTTTLPHPLKGRPLDETVTDAFCDDIAAKRAPLGWAPHHVIQARSKTGVRILRVTFRRTEGIPLFPMDGEPKILVTFVGGSK